MDHLVYCVEWVTCSNHCVLRSFPVHPPRVAFREGLGVGGLVFIMILRIAVHLCLCW